jgi:hypothetical protein
MTLSELAKRIRTNTAQPDLQLYFAAKLADLREDFESREANEFVRGQIDLIKTLMKELK